MSHTEPGLHATTTPPMRTPQPATLLGSGQAAALGEATMAQRIGLAVVTPRSVRCSSATLS